MGAKHSPEWHNIARTMRANGATVREIMDATGKRSQTIAYALDTSGGVRRRREAKRARPKEIKKTGGKHMHDATNIETWEDRKRRRAAERGPRPKVDTLAICAQFARHEIDRATLSRMLRGE